MPETRWLINNRNAFLTVLRLGGPISQCQHGLTLVRAFFPGPTAVTLGPGEGSLCGLFHESPTPIHEGPPSGPNHLPKAPPSDTTTLGIRVLTYEFGCGGHKYLDHCKGLNPFLEKFEHHSSNVCLVFCLHNWSTCSSREWWCLSSLPLPEGPCNTDVNEYLSNSADLQVSSSDCQSTGHLLNMLWKHFY